MKTVGIMSGGSRVLAVRKFIAKLLGLDMSKNSFGFSATMHADEAASPAAPRSRSRTLPSPSRPNESAGAAGGGGGGAGPEGRQPERPGDHQGEPAGTVKNVVLKSSCTLGAVWRWQTRRWRTSSCRKASRAHSHHRRRLPSTTR